MPATGAGRRLTATAGRLGGARQWRAADVRPARRSHSSPPWPKTTLPRSGTTGLPPTTGRRNIRCATPAPPGTIRWRCARPTCSGTGASCSWKSPSSRRPASCTCACASAARGRSTSLPPCMRSRPHSPTSPATSRSPKFPVPDAPMSVEAVTASPPVRIPGPTAPPAAPSPWKPRSACSSPPNTSPPPRVNESLWLSKTPTSCPTILCSPPPGRWPPSATRSTN